MTKQEEVRAEVRSAIDSATGFKPGSCPVDGLTDSLIKSLHSQGVVIKVREAILSKGVYNKGSFTLKRETVCTAVEPLIEVK